MFTFTFPGWHRGGGCGATEFSKTGDRQFNWSWFINDFGWFRWKLILRFKYISFYFAILAIAMLCTEETGEKKLWRRELCRWELRVGASVPEEIPRSGSCKSFCKSYYFVIPVITMKEEVNRAYEEGSSEDENSELEHQSQRKFPDQVAANILVRFPDLVREPGFKRLHNPCH